MTREDYRRVKNMSRAELEDYLRRVYLGGYEAGMKKLMEAAPATAGEPENEAVQGEE